MTRTDRPAWSFAVALAAVALVAPAVARAQSAPAHGHENPCFEHIPADSMRRVPVYLEAQASDSATRALLPKVGVFTQTVALRILALMGAQPNGLPHGDPTITWRSAAVGAAITVYRDVRLVWTAADGDGGGAFALLDTALQSVRRDGGPWFLWPDSTLDSLVFDLKLRVPLVDHEGPAVFVVPVRNGVPVFTVLRPWGESAHVIRPPHVWYPQGLDRSGVEGSLVVQFVVDTNGRADPATVRDLWPSDRPRLTGELGAYYDRFLGTVKSALEDARFQPANVGGCPIRQIVKMPFTFHVRR